MEVAYICPSCGYSYLYETEGNTCAPPLMCNFPCLTRLSRVEDPVVVKALKAVKEGKHERR